MVFNESLFTVRAQIHNAALPGANTNLITDIAGPSTTSAGLVMFRIYACTSIAGDLNLKRTRGGVTTTEKLFTLVPNVPQNFDNVAVDQAETINLQLSTTTGTMIKLFVIEKSVP